MQASHFSLNVSPVSMALKSEDSFVKFRAFFSIQKILQVLH